MSLAVGGHKGRSTYLYAGVNSGKDDVLKGKNEHLRALTIDQIKSRPTGSPSKSPLKTKALDPKAEIKDPSVKIQEASRTAAFTDPIDGVFQRVLRLAPGGRMGAVAAAMGKEPQLAVFEPNGANPKVKGVLELPREAEDVDIVQTGEGEYQVAFCYKYQLHVVNVGKELSEPELVYTMPEENLELPAFRCIRYLTPEFILAVSNLPKRSGMIIQGLRLPKSGEGNARLACSTRIPGATSATALAVTNLSPPASPTSPAGDAQFTIAVAGHDSSIYFYAVNHVTNSSITILSNLHPFHTIKSAHGNDAITGLAFSTFVTPKTHMRPQHIKLASATLGNFVSVTSVPLRRHIDQRPKGSKGPARPTRYVVAMKSQAQSGSFILYVLGVIVLILAVLGQGILEMYGQATPRLHVHKFLPSWHGTLRSPEHQPNFFAGKGGAEVHGVRVPDFLSKLVDDVPSTTEGEALVIVDHTPEISGDEGVEKKLVKVDVHDGEVHAEAKAWEDLAEEQKDAWRERLMDAGAWTAEMGESVFRGILFGELAGAVGRAVGG